MNAPRPKPRPSRQRFGGFGAVLERVAIRIGKLQKLEVKLVVDTFADELFAAVRKDGSISWPGRGTLCLTKRKARDIAHPRTREKMRLPASVGIGFRAAKAEKERLRGPA